jgi:hypothetical protein
MNRLLYMAVLLFCFAVVSVPALAQARGMRGGAVFHGGAGGMRGGAAFRGGGFGQPVGVRPVGGRPFGPVVRVGPHGFPGTVVVRGGVAFGHNPRFGVFFGSPCFGNPFCGNRFFFHRKSAFGFGFPWWGWGSGLPLYGGYPYGYPYYDYADYSVSAPAQTYASAPPEAYTSAAVERELRDLHDEVQALREEQLQRDRAAQQKAAKPETGPDTVLVFRDGRREEVKNYAVVGKTLWIFNQNRARKLPLADLDIPASKQENAARGVEFAIGSAR